MPSSRASGSTWPGLVARPRGRSVLAFLLCSVSNVTKKWDAPILPFLMWVKKSNYREHGGIQCGDEGRSLSWDAGVCKTPSATSDKWETECCRQTHMVSELFWSGGAIPRGRCHAGGKHAVREKVLGSGLCLSRPAVCCGQRGSSWRPARLTDLDFISAPIPSISVGLACHSAHIQR